MALRSWTIAQLSCSAAGAPSLAVLDFHARSYFSIAFRVRRIRKDHVAYCDTVLVSRKMILQQDNADFCVLSFTYTTYLTRFNLAQCFRAWHNALPNLLSFAFLQCRFTVHLKSKDVVLHPEALPQRLTRAVGWQLWVIGGIWTALGLIEIYIRGKPRRSFAYRFTWSPPSLHLGLSRVRTCQVETVRTPFTNCAQESMVVLEFFTSLVQLQSHPDSIPSKSC